MSTTITGDESTGDLAIGKHIRLPVKAVMIGGVPHYRVEELDALMEMEIREFVSKVYAGNAPQVMSAKVARESIDALHKGLGGKLEELQDLIQSSADKTRIARDNLTGTVSIVSKGVKEMRSMIETGELDRVLVKLNEFVGLCERLERLEQSGMLSKIVTTFSK